MSGLSRSLEQAGRWFLHGRWFLRGSPIKAVAAVFLSHEVALVRCHSMVGHAGCQGGRCAVTEMTSQPLKFQSGALLTNESIKNAQSHWAEHQGP